jgi:hypothetical protein
MALQQPLVPNLTIYMTTRTQISSWWIPVDRKNLRELIDEDNSNSYAPNNGLIIVNFSLSADWLVNNKSVAAYNVPNKMKQSILK